MIDRRVRVLSAVVTSFSMALVSGCGSSTPAASAAPTTVSTAIAKVQSGVAKANISSYTTPTAFEDMAMIKNQSQQPPHIRTASNMTNADWTTSTDNIANLKCGGNNCGVPSGSSPALWLQDMLSPTFANTNGSNVGLMGRFFSAVSQSCVIGYALGGIPSPGTQTIAVTQDMVTAANAVCNSNTTISKTLTITFTTTDVSNGGSGTFDRKITMSDPSGAVNQTLWIKNDGTNVRVMNATENSNQGYPYMSRYFADYNLSTQVARFEGLERGYAGSGQSGGLYFYRIWTNGSTGEVRILGQNGGVQNNSGTYALLNRAGVAGSGNYNQADATIEIVAGTGVSIAFDEVGCINMSTGVVDSGVSAGACSGRAVNWFASGGPDALINTTVLNTAQSGWTMSEAISAMGFDDTTIFSAAPTN